MKPGFHIFSAAAVAAALASGSVCAEMASDIKVLNVKSTLPASTGGVAGAASQPVVYTASDGTTYTQQDLDNLKADVLDAGNVQNATGAAAAGANAGAAAKVDMKEGTTEGCSISRAEAKAMAADNAKMAESFQKATGEALSDMTQACKDAFKQAVEACAQEEDATVTEAKKDLTALCVEENQPPQVDTPNPQGSDGTATADTTTATTPNATTTAGTTQTATASSSSLSNLLQQAALQALLEKLFASSSGSEDEDEDDSADTSDDEDQSDSKTCDNVDDDSEIARFVANDVASDGGKTVTTRVERICDNGNTQIVTSVVQTDAEGNVVSSTTITTVE